MHDPFSHANHGTVGMCHVIHVVALSVALGCFV